MRSQEGTMFEKHAGEGEARAQQRYRHEQTQLPGRG